MKKSLRTPLGPGAEFDLIRSVLLSDLGGDVPAELLVGPGDDAAVLRVAENVVLSTDLSVEGIHFRTEWLTATEVGYRAVAAALSDLAAMAAKPLGVLLSIGADQDRAGAWVPAIAAGAREALDATGGALLGGDLSRVPDGAPILIDVVAVGQAANPITRRGAQAGDEVWVTGVLGWPAHAVMEWNEGRTPSATARMRFARPVPRVREAAWLRQHAEVSAMIDLSDGLAADAGHLAAASGVGISVRVEALPVPTELVKVLGLKGATALALSGGEEYELCFAARSGSVVEEVAAEFTSRFDVSLTRVGEVTTGAGVNIVGAELSELGLGHDHFRTDPLA